MVKSQLDAQSEGRGLWLEEKEQAKKMQTQQEFWGVSTDSSVPKLSAGPKFYHYPSCKLLYNADGKLNNPTLIVMFMSAEDARAHGYTPCNVCRPPYKSSSD